MITYYTEENNKIVKTTRFKNVAEKWGNYKETEKEIVYGWDGNFYFSDEQQPDIPIEYQNEQIRQQRQARYEAESDPIRLDYDEALARGEESAETLKEEWLASKDKIREELPYIIGE